MIGKFIKFSFFSGFLIYFAIIKIFNLTVEYKPLEINVEYFIVILIFISLIIISMFLIATSNKYNKGKYKRIARWQLFSGFILILFMINEKVFSSVILMFIMILVSIVVVLSIFSLIILKKIIKIDAFIESDDSDHIRKDTENFFHLKIYTPNWYKFIPFNVGNTSIKIKYGIKGERALYKNINIVDKKDTTLDIKFKYKGEFKIGVAQVDLVDTLNLMKQVIRFKFDDIKIYPKHTKVKYKPNYSRDGDELGRDQLAKQGEKFDTKIFEKGDSLKQVNWKMFSKQQELYVRHEEMSSFVGMRVIFFDNRMLAIRDTQKYMEEKMTEVLVSLIETIKLSRETFKLFYYGRNNDVVELKTTKRKFEEIYEEISFIKFINNVSRVQEELMNKKLFSLSAFGECVMITAEFNRNNYQLMYKLKGNNAKIRLLKINYGVKEDNDDTEKLCKKLRINYLEIKINHEVKRFNEEML